MAKPEFKFNCCRQGSLSSSFLWIERRNAVFNVVQQKGSRSKNGSKMIWQFLCGSVQCGLLLAVLPIFLLNDPWTRFATLLRVLFLTTEKIPPHSRAILGGWNLCPLCHRNFLTHMNHLQNIIAGMFLPWQAWFDDMADRIIWFMHRSFNLMFERLSKSQKANKFIMCKTDVYTFQQIFSLSVNKG